MMLDPRWWRLEVVRPALERIGLWSESAEVLVTGTALCESRLRWTKQIGGGPALGVYQIEPRTHASLWADLLAYREPLAVDVLRLVDRDPSHLQQTQLGWHALARGLEPELVYWRGGESIAEGWAYATAMARIRYLWDPHPLPHEDDALELARLYKRSFNSAFGAATVLGSVPYFEMARAA